MVLVGEGLGGAIVSGYGGDLFGPNTLTVSNSTLTQNTAQGGDNNTGTATVAGLVGPGAGAGIANYAGGTASVSGSELDHNQASGGQHNTASGAGAVFAGLGAGGGIFNYLGNYNSSGYGLLDRQRGHRQQQHVDHNLAQGGGGGNGEGGGIANVLDATTTVANSTIAQNQANGGGGAGLGGGACNDATSSLALTVSVGDPEPGQRLPGDRRRRSTPLGCSPYDSFTVIADNHASTGGNNIGP